MGRDGRAQMEFVFGNMRPADCKKDGGMRSHVAPSPSPYSSAILDFLSGRRDAVFEIERSDGSAYEVPVSSYFEVESLSPIEEARTKHVPWTSPRCRRRHGASQSSPGTHGLPATSVDVASTTLK